MRHLWSLLAGLVIAPLTWVLLAYANGGLFTAAMQDERDRLIAPMIVIVVAGLLVGSIASLRFSPLGPLFGGLLLISVSVLQLAIPHDFNGALPELPTIKGLERAELIIPVSSGELLLVGVILIIGVFSAQRWRTWPRPQLHPTVGPVNPMVDTGRIEAIKSWSPFEDTGSTPTAATPTIANPIVYTPEGASTSPISAGKHASLDKTETDGASPWAAPPTNR
jgi:hypothetical protein